MRVCTRCCMDTTDPQISFDANGVCNHCWEWDVAMRQHTVPGLAGQQHLKAVVEKITSSKKGRFNCVLGISGGYDSSYAAYLAAKHGLSPYCISVDNGYDTAEAIGNVKNLCRTLSFVHETIKLDRNEFRDLQLSYLKAGVINLEIPSDNAINALVYHTANMLGLKYVITGQNIVTEWTMPKSWGWDNGDMTNLKNIHKKFGTVPLRTYPMMGHLLFSYYTVVRGITTVPILNYVEYDKSIAKATLEKECGWVNYGAKHHESHITRFYQCYILPKYWGIDKRTAHLSCLIRAGQMTRQEALDELAKPPCSPAILKEDMVKVCEYLGLTEKQLDDLLSQPHHAHAEYGAEPRGDLLTRAYWFFLKLRGVR